MTDARTIALDRAAEIAAHIARSEAGDFLQRVVDLAVPDRVRIAYDYEVAFTIDAAFVTRRGR